MGMAGLTDAGGAGTAGQRLPVSGAPGARSSFQRQPVPWWLPPAAGGGPRAARARRPGSAVAGDGPDGRGTLDGGFEFAGKNFGARFQMVWRSLISVPGAALARRAAWALLAALLAPGVLAGAARAADENPIVVENRKPGNPASEWDVAGSGSSAIQGFTTNISYNVGETVSFKVKTSAASHRLDIYRVGYYGGMGARKVATVPGTRVTQPACRTSPAVGLVDCGNWSVTATWPIPATAVSGVYFAKLVRTGTTDGSHVFFIVRDDSSRSDLLFQTSDTTWQAYNAYGGSSLYQGGSVGRAYKVSYNRPMVWRAGTYFSGISNFFNAEYPMVRWLEANGYDVSYFSGVDTDRYGGLIRNHKTFMSVGHDEYWSGAQRANVEAARGAGVNLAFFSGNTMFWKTRWENSIDGSATPYRTLPLTYKETLANQPIDPFDPPIWTGTWRDPRFSPPADGGRPENAVMGTIFTVNGVQFNDLTVPGDYGRLRLWRNTDLATMDPLQTATLGRSLLGYEWEEDLDNGFRPRGLMRLSSTTAQVSGRLVDYGSSYAPGPATHNLTLYRHPSGALVFGAGTIQWSWGLDAVHDNNAGAPTAGPDRRVQQATVNLFADMGVQPGSLQAPLVAATASTDATPPTSRVNPVPGGSVPVGSAVVISGTAADAGGGAVGGVEISVDGGNTWHPAAGRGNWSYAWVPTAVGPATIRSAAVDDSGNLETSGGTLTVNVVAGTGASARIWSPTAVPAIASVNDPNPVEVGVKFMSEVSGSITGIRFYKGGNNTGAHFGHLWRGDGTLLATATFENETASGWQYAPFPSPVPINANTTYVASYHAPNGFYSVTNNYFAGSGVDNPPLHALRDGVDGPNGVYAYGGSGFPLFPSSTFQANNYWVDVDFAPSSPTPGPAPDNTTIWASSVIPPLASVDDTAAVELGVKFRVDQTGSITGVRFFKGAANTGAHVGKLWSVDGTLLASATFANETASGWQQVNFANPVPVVAGTTYVASYHTNVGRYAASLDYFAATGVDSPPLYALRNGVSGGNGVYLYGSGGFPTQTYRSANYWVDVVFQPAPAGPAMALARIDKRPRKLSRIKYPRTAWRAAEDDAEGYTWIKPGTRGVLNGGKVISPEGQ